ncbi:MAG TPA: molybdate ABC transporter substrate-binding protein [Polyangia bacterium]
MAVSRPSFAAAEDKVLTVFAASSLKEAFSRITPAFERAHHLRVRFAFAGTQELRTQLEHGAQPDVFAAADTKHTTALEKAGLIGPSTFFAQNRLAIIVPRGNPAGIRKFADLPRSRRLVVGANEVPVGVYAAQAIAKAANALGAAFANDVNARVVSRELNVKQIVAKVLLGEADAGIVYETDARAAAGKVESIEIPAAFNVMADHPAAVVANSKHGDLARAFVDTLSSAWAQKELRALGFEPPAPAQARRRK